ncbi:hypothetical protein [Nocardiopsis sp. MG754419]|uniref:hypothetical protein n=1 Tax=Nocardiopsis sp. MG754419 TaxID=2259865 RepID=UPI001BAD941C|nr:hypothetical protein [Nocardiopsis sp. MG754419]MBR8744691.1 hypothetical protein [Nocardiopsis sp. MG754419]
MGGTQHKTTIISRLNEQWEQVREDFTAQHTVQNWSSEDLRLRDARSVEDIRALADGPVTPATDELFRALLDRTLRTGAEGELASRIVLQLMIGRVVHTSRSMTGYIRDIEERSQLAVVAMYDAIRICPRDKDTYLTPHLAWTAHRTAMRLAKVGANEVPMASVGAERTTVDEPDAHPSEELAQLLAWSVAEGVLNAGDATLLAQRYGDESPGRPSWTSVADPGAVAGQAGITPQAMRQRCSRAARRLAAASARYLGHEAD